jgi:hypothetical protein
VSLTKDRSGWYENSDDSDRLKSQVIESNRRVRFPLFLMEESQIENQLNDLQTDEGELDEVLAKYDLDES